MSTISSGNRAGYRAARVMQELLVNPEFHRLAEKQIEAHANNYETFARAAARAVWAAFDEIDDAVMTTQQMTSTPTA